MNENVVSIKELIKGECKTLGFVPEWFFEEHLEIVEKHALDILAKVPSADKEVVILGVWLHDTQRIRGLKADHQDGGVQEAKKIMNQFNYSEDIIKKVQGIIQTHSCDNEIPNTVEGRVLATADAMAHYTSDFFLRIAILGYRDVKEYKKWALEKIEKNYNKKISFDFAQDEIRNRHNIIKNFLINK